MTSYVRLCTLMKTVWINKVRKREVESGHKILSLEIPLMYTSFFPGSNSILLL
nr:MAG TPA: hypothetical protein [Caudoviricetes sp.]